jgi:23S rRNA (cytosine1962-C5)-methyltransferase
MVSKTYKNITISNFKNYELIDSGDGEKLEKLGEIITIRPEPQAIWGKRLKENQWNKQAHVKFVSKSSSSGIWNKLKPNVPETWYLTYNNNALKLKFKLALTNFKHVGIFPEQSDNWDFIYNSVKRLPKPKVLNLFAYTGGASLAAKQGGADVTHVDSIKQVVTWARNNMELSNLDNIRWIVEDAMKFIKRAERRKEVYQGIIFDPPAYGHGPKGESWKLERDLKELINAVLNVLDKKHHFLVLNTYSLNLSPMVLDNLLTDYINFDTSMELGEVYIKSSTEQLLPLGNYARLQKFSS